MDFAEILTFEMRPEIQSEHIHHINKNDYIRTNKTIYNRISLQTYKLPINKILNNLFRILA